jgi:glycerol kinase
VVSPNEILLSTATDPRSRLRDNLEIIKETREAGELAAQVEDTGGVYFVTVRLSQLLPSLY